MKKAINSEVAKCIKSIGQDLLYECSSLECKLSNELIKNEHLEQQVKTQQLMINKAIDLLNAYIGVLDDTSDLYFENVKSILELEVKKEK